MQLHNFPTSLCNIHGMTCTAVEVIFFFANLFYQTGLNNNDKKSRKTFLLKGKIALDGCDSEQI